MAESPTTKPHVEKEDSYRAFVTDLARKVPRFAPLNAFFQQTTTAAAVSTLITFSDQTAPSTPRQLTFDDLKHELESGSEEAKLFIVENLCPDAAALLGGHCNVDPQCFLDYLDKYQLETPDENWKRKAGQFSPINWYRIDGVDEHLPILHSEKSELDHVHFRYIEAEEFYPDDPTAPPLQLPINLEQKEGTGSIDRVAGAWHSVPRDNKIFNAAAMTRHCATAWFDGRSPQNQWKRGIVLLDPAFQPKELSVPRKDFRNFRQRSKYRSFAARPLPPDMLKEADIDRRKSYRLTLLHCIANNARVQVPGVPAPILILRDLYRIIASEWTAVNTYVERDLNTIEWRIERESHATLDIFEPFLEKLFRLRRRVNKYEALVKDQLRSISTQRDMLNSGTPANDGDSAFNQISKALESDYNQVLELIQRNANRITQSTHLITSLMSVRASKTQVAQSQRLSILTVLATFVLPFNTIAAILAIQGDYGPTGSKFWIFWAATGTVSCLILFSLVIPYMLYVRISRRKGPVLK